MSSLLARALRFDAVAADQIILDPEVASCWELIRSGIRMSSLTPDGIEEVIGLLRAKRGTGHDEISVEIDPEDGARARVIVLDDERSCSAEGLIRELERFLRNVKGVK